MKQLTLALLGVALLATVATGVSARDWQWDRGVVIECDNDGSRESTSFDFDRETVVIEHREGRIRDVVEIHPDHRLVINGQEIALDRRQEALVAEFYDGCDDICNSARRIGWEGARIGLDGAKLGVRAIGCVFKLLSPDYDSDDMERELELEAARIEAKAEVLEAKAERIEEIADDLEAVAEDMRRAIPELNDLDWWL